MATRDGAFPKADGLPRGQGECVLVVDDEPEIREMVVESLQGLGYATRVAEDAGVALRMLADGAGIDLLFTDIVMPGGQDGMQLVRETRRRWPDLPVLLTSGYVGREADAPWSRDIPILHKPYRVGMLARAVRACLDGRGE